VNGILPLVTLAAIATAVTVMLERGGRAGYGWVTGSEFVLFGVALGPVGLDLLSSDLLSSLHGAVVLGAAWLGLRYGLRLRPRLVQETPLRVRLAGLVEPVVVLLALRGMLWLLTRQAGLPLPGATAWAIAAVGSATTKSAAAWARAQLFARGPRIDAIEGISAMNDLVALVGTAVLVPRLRPVATRLPAHALTAIGATLVLGVALGALVALLAGGRRGPFRPDLGWIALFGACALGCGVGASLGLSPMAVAFAAGALVAVLSPHAGALEELTRNTERPGVLVLLLLAGAMLKGTTLAIALGAGAAVLRLVAKVLSGAVAAQLLPIGGRKADLGLGLLGTGGVAFAAAMELSESLGESGEVVLAAAVAMALLGDFVGSPMLRLLLERASELPAPPGPTTTTPEAS
jgi:hypothetical protein